MLCRIWCKNSQIINKRYWIIKNSFYFCIELNYQ